MSDYVAGKAWKQEKYDRILKVGFKLFSEEGIEQATMGEVSDNNYYTRTHIQSEPYIGKYR